MSRHSGGRHSGGRHGGGGKSGGSSGGGHKSSFLDNPFGGIFDFNHDGKEDIGEQWFAHKMFEECTKNDNSTSNTSFFDFGGSSIDYDDDYSWRDFCDDGLDYGLDPEDYETEEEYEDAIEEAQYEASMNMNNYIPPTQSYEASSASVSDIHVSSESEKPKEKQKEIRESDYPNKRSYNAACALANAGGFITFGGPEYLEKEKERCRFILEKSETVVAARYLTHNGHFLYAQAVKDNFKLPITLPDEDEKREFELCDIIKKLVRKDIPLSFEVWEWCLDNFLEYKEYDESALHDLTYGVCDKIYSFQSFCGDDYSTEFIKYISSHPKFRIHVIREGYKAPLSLPRLVVDAIYLGLNNTAKDLFEDGMVLANDDWKIINDLMGRTIIFARNSKELETIECVEENLLPIVKAIPDGMVSDEIEGWEREIAEYKTRVEKSCEQYAYTRGNAWRTAVPDGSEYGLDPRWYESEDEYLDALKVRKYAWRSMYEQKDILGLCLTDYEREEDFLAVYRPKFEEKLKEEREERIRKEREKYKKKSDETKTLPISDDKNIYIYCGVMLPFSTRPYSFRTEDESIKIGDDVVVRVGNEQEEVVGTVASIGRYTRLAVPYPVERTKLILCKAEKTEK